MAQRVDFRVGSASCEHEEVRESDCRDRLFESRLNRDALRLGELPAHHVRLLLKAVVLVAQIADEHQHPVLESFLGSSLVRLHTSFLIPISVAAWAAQLGGLLPQVEAQTWAEWRLSAQVVDPD